MRHSQLILSVLGLVCLASPAAFSSLIPPAAMEGIYQDLLLKPIPAAGSNELTALNQTWKTAQAEKSARTCFLLGILRKKESLQAVAAHAFRDYLDRTMELTKLAQLPEAAKAAEKLAGSDDPLSFYASLLSSDEAGPKRKEEQPHYVRSLYLKILDRQPSSAEVGIALAGLGKREKPDREALSARLFRSDQARALIVKRWYERLLHREGVEPKKISMWVARWKTLNNYYLALADFLEAENFFRSPPAASPGAPGPYACAESDFAFAPGPSYRDHTLSVPLVPTSGLEARQLRELGKEGVDVALVVWREKLRTETLIELVRARERLREAGEAVPFLGLLYDYPSGGDTEGTFYPAIRDFLSYIPPEHRARFDRKPLIFLGDPTDRVEVSEKWGNTLAEKFPETFGTPAFLVKPRDRLVARLKKRSDLTVLARLIESGHSLRAVLKEYLSLGDFPARFGNDRVAYAEELFLKLFNRSAQGKASSGFSPVREDWYNMSQGLVGTRETGEVMAARWIGYYEGRLAPFDELLGSSEARKLASHLNGSQADLEILAKLLAGDSLFRLNGRSAEAFVDDLYQKVLVRCPSPEERNSALARLLKDGSRDGLVKEVLFNEEASRTFLAQWEEFFVGKGLGPAAGVYDTGSEACPLFPGVATIFVGDGKDYARSWERALARDPRPAIVFLESPGDPGKKTKMAALTRQYADRYHGRK